MKDDEIFLKRWKNIRKKGKCSYILINSVQCALGFWILAIIYLIITRNYFYQLTSLFFPAFVGAIVVEIIILFRRWNNNEEKYNLLIKK